MCYAKFGNLASTHQIGGVQLQRPSTGAPGLRQLPLPQKQARPVPLQAAVDPDDASVSSSKIGNT